MTSKYITPDGRKALFDELEHLLRVERPRVTQQVSEAAALGDRSENAEYIYGKRRLREIDRRLRFLQKRLDEVEVVQPPEPGAPIDKVRFGAWVTVESEEGEVTEYRIVGADESDATKHLISIDSPVARALVGKQAGDEITVKVPRGESTYTIHAIRYVVQGQQ